MKNLICILLIWFGSFPVYCQVIAIQNDRENILYLGIDNPLTVAVENCSSSSIELTTNNGKIAKRENGHYYIVPENPGLLTIYVYRYISKETKLIDSTIYRVNRIPVKTSFWGKTEGEISALKVYHGIAPSATVYGLMIDAKLPIIKFTVIVKRNGIEVFKRDLQNPDGTRFDDETKDFFKTLQNGDKFLITNIVATDVDKTKRQLEGIEFTITNAEDIQEDLKNRDEPRTVVDPITGQEAIIKD